MKAWVLTGLGRENLKRVEIPAPKPKSHEVLIRVSAVSLNYRDKLIAEGIYNQHLEFPIVQVADAVGEVVEAGDDVTRFRTGERVITQYATRWIDGNPGPKESKFTLGNTIQGALAEYVALDEQALVHAPAYLTDDEAATISCAGLTAWYSLVDRGGLQRGDSVLVQGTGGVSLFGLQIASAFGAEVIVTSSSDEKLERAKVLGAKYAINYVKTPAWEQKALEITNGRGVDQILEVVGGNSVIQSLAAIRPGGTITIIGVLDGLTAEIPLLQLIARQAVIRGVSVGPRRALEEMVAAFEKLQIRPVIDKIYGFDDALEAYEHLYRGPFGKVVIRIRD